MLKLDIGFLSTSLAIFMNNQDPQTPRKMKKNGVKNLKRAQATPEFHPYRHFL
jgi:CRISPR/Cas system Type II protein with McrA/HNH and RuvC-like nuclease domain